MSVPVEVVVVGSGPSAVHGAWRLVEAGRKVLMLDVGHEDTAYTPLIPELPFAEIRRTDALQHRYFLGDRFEGIPLGSIGTGAQLTPPRQHVFRDCDKHLPVSSSSFTALQSLARGGLGAAWGAGCFPFLPAELECCGLPVDSMPAHYETVARRIGISGERDDLAQFWGPLPSLQPALELDGNAERILDRYREKRAWFRSRGLALGRPPLAVLTEPLKDRSAERYFDLDFWSNPGDAVYRPQVSLRELEKFPNFTYRPQFLVQRFREQADGRVHVMGCSLNSRNQESISSDRLILAAGALATTRLVLRSLELYDTKVPNVCNAHCYIPALHLRNLGRKSKERCFSLAQLSIIHDPTGDGRHLVQAQLFSYQSLLLFRLLKELPLPYHESLRILRSLAPSMVILLIQHEDHASSAKTCTLRKTGTEPGDVLEIDYREDAEQEQRQRQSERLLASSLRKLGCWPRKTVRPGHGSSIHYGGQLPISVQESPLTTAPTGRLHGARCVFVADGAALRYLPAKGLTLTLMANADRVGSIVLESLERA